MNTNPQAKTVLCFGDSNTRGSAPDGVSRYAADVRWTGQLQSNLGSDYYVIEEGLGGRTTDVDDLRPEKPGRNGLVYFKPCLNGHGPVDVVVIMLGTNDFKNTFNKSAKDVADSLRQYVDFARETSLAKDIVLVSPAYITPTKPIVFYDDLAAEKSSQLAGEIKAVADDYGLPFFDAASTVVTGEDGLHWDVESNKRFADAIADIVRSLA